jgi:hypothetical protein
MEAKDVWILLAGGVLGFIASLLATFTAPSVGSAFGKLKSGFIERNKARALASYAHVRDLKLGKRDKYLYAMNSWGLNSVEMFFFIGGCVGGLSSKDAGVPQVIKSVLLLISSLALVSAIRRTSILLLTLDRIANFEDYRANILRRWPDVQLPD